MVEENRGFDAGCYFEVHADHRFASCAQEIPMNNSTPRHTARSGAGLVIANMIGVGVLLSTGFMAQDMSAGPILLAWIVGTTIAFLGVISYSTIVISIQESGGEYRFLSDLVHPFLGYLARFGAEGSTMRVRVHRYTNIFRKWVL